MWCLNDKRKEKERISKQKIRIKKAEEKEQQDDKRKEKERIRQQKIRIKKAKEDRDALDEKY